MLLVFIFMFFLVLISTAKVKITILISEGKANILFAIFIFRKICIYKNKINHIKGTRKNRIGESVKNNNILIVKIIKSGKFNIDQLNLSIGICTEDAVATSYLVAIVSSLISILIKISNVRINYKKCNYTVKPIYSSQKVLNIKLKCIITKNLVHIIFIIYRNIKDWRREKYGRKSPNRRAYGNCNG